MFLLSTGLSTATVIPMTVISLPDRQAGGLTQRVAAEVRALKGRHDVTQEQLANVLGVAQPAVSKRLRGVTPFTLDELEKLSDFFGLDGPEELLGGQSNPRPGGPDGGERGGLVRHQGLEPRTRCYEALAA